MKPQRHAVLLDRKCIALARADLWKLLFYQIAIVVHEFQAGVWNKQDGLIKFKAKGRIGLSLGTVHTDNGIDLGLNALHAFQVFNRLESSLIAEVHFDDLRGFVLVCNFAVDSCRVLGVAPDATGLAASSDQSNTADRRQVSLHRGVRVSGRGDHEAAEVRRA